MDYPHSFSADDPTHITVGYLNRANFRTMKISFHRING